MPLLCSVSLHFVCFSSTLWALGHSVTRTQVSYFSSSDEGQAGMSESALSVCCAPSYWLDLDTSTLIG